uniref:Uncharacterized protein n=2 Tax=Vibrionaceae TaxID=641 RepID=A0A0H3ZKV0_VIBSP|nr:hypothetical protein [Vibrio splendidus]AKN40560.1 hypothetical protein [Enterovibrio norvegicus]
MSNLILSANNNAILNLCTVFVQILSANKPNKKGFSSHF